MKRQVIFIAAAIALYGLLVTFTITTPQPVVAMLADATPALITALTTTLPLTPTLTPALTPTLTPLPTPFEQDLVMAPLPVGENPSFHAAILVPRTAFIREQFIFRQQMVFEWRFDPAQGQANSIIASVAITIFKGTDDESGEPVYHRIETKAPYCAFGHTGKHCDRVWVFADTDYTWPQSNTDTIQPGNLLFDPDSPYTAQMVMTTRDGQTGEWDFTFRMQSPDPSAPRAGVHFVHIASAANIHLNWTEIDRPLSNGNPHAVLFVSPNWNPDNKPGVYNNHPIGVWYNPKTKRWGIFNQDLAPMPPGAAFNVLIFPN